MNRTLFNTFRAVRATAIDLPQTLLESLGCGLFRCPLPLAYGLLPELSALYDSAPVENPEEWELDIKIHMLMANQYPCIPNWHCDNVKRVDGQVRYDLIESQAKPMYLWISDGPHTEFLANPLEVLGAPKGHHALADYIRSSKVPTKFLPAQTWIRMDQRTPHRGTLAKEDGWRVFARLTHKSIAPVRPVLNFVRRLCQVYLDATSFEW